MELLNKRYKLGRVLGQGAMGRVHLAQDVTTNQQVAIKECFAQNNDELIERIKREYELMKSMDHPGVVKAIDFLHFDNKYFIVMEFIEGITLHELIQRGRRTVKFVKQLEIAIKICEAVYFLNKNGIIHRDLKPQNIILDANYNPKILDLGIAKLENVDHSITQTGNIIGTPTYMSPEQIDGKSATNSDVFSTAVILYQFFSWAKQSPFHGHGAISSMTNVVEKKLPPINLKLAYKNYEVRLGKTFAKSMRKDHEKRSKTVENMLTAFKDTLKAIKRKEIINKVITTVGSTLVTGLFILLWVLRGSFMVDNDSPLPNTHFEDGNTFFSQQKYSEAITEYRKAINLGEKSGEIFYNIGLCYSSLEKYQKSIKYYTEALRYWRGEVWENPYSASGHFQRARAYVLTKQFEKALKDLNKTLEILHKMKAFGDLGSANQVKKTAKEIDEELAAAYFLRGVLHYENQKNTATIQDLKKAITLNPSLKKQASEILEKARANLKK
ncbi:protein kinase domain-containing protein [Candidatus Uabimicrobium amorphum]|uniref:Protein kinase n=1 Tax=Uabimicrobium amorphum TaxID=2596890 RepID=A0A5S9F293_UABAM|nr:protein kinase [Candidatus Uabimicrobium amorphum]BBM83376.1 protein kinase [Candidatus Uabimicrobium amorphum]